MMKKANLSLRQSAPGLLPMPAGRAAREFVLAPSEHQALKNPNPEGYGYLPIELFETGKGWFVFDAKNVCFLEVERVAFDMLTVLRDRSATIDELISALPQHPESDIRDAYKDLVDAQAQGLLVSYNFKRAARHDNSRYQEVLEQSMAGFTLFVTTRCNLGCSYCIYGGQYDQHEQLSQTPMPWTTLKAAMDFLEKHSRKSAQVRLDFFGGEPLLAFEMIEKAVLYLKTLITSGAPRVIVTITSNGTVLTDRILEFLVANDVYLQFSIDGARDSHDAYRTFKGTTRGSFDTILKNLQRIYDRDPVYFRQRMRLKGVLNTATMEADDTEFFNHNLIKIIIEAGNFIYLDLEPHYDLAKDADYFARLAALGERLLSMRDLESESDLISRLNIKQRALYYHTFGRFFEGQTINRVHFDGIDEVPFSKGCLTGYQEGAVNANGDISICLKSAKGGNFVIGNVLEGRWHYEKMKELNTVFHRDWAGCSSCFVQKICELCYEKLNGEDGRWVAGRAKFCNFNRESHRRIFATMLRVIENNPPLWKSLEDQISDALEARSPAGDASIGYASQSLYARSPSD